MVNQATKQPSNQVTVTHIPVLLNEVLEFTNPQPGEFFIDGTAGAGGHSKAIQERIGLSGKLLAIDWEKTGENYADLAEILERKNLGKANGLLLDLGFSSEQIDGNLPVGKQGKGFSFQKNEPLLMTYDANTEPLKEILRKFTEEELAKIIKELGEERWAKKIARAIYEEERRKPIETTLALAEIIRKAVPRSYEHGRLHPATRTFMAFRIYVNHELENLKKVLGDLEKILKSGGKAAIISFHSSEDRLVKNSFRDYAKAGKMKILTKKPITATKEEIAANPRSRSAKLRVAVLLSS